MGEKAKIAFGSFLGLSIALLFMTIMALLSQGVAYSWDAIGIVPTSTGDQAKIDIGQPNFSYQIHSPALINLAFTLVFALFISSILFLSIKMRLK